MTEATSQPETNGQAGRDTSTGRFSAGNHFGRGRPPRDVELAYFQSFARGCPPEKLEAVVESLAGKACGGDVQAARVLLQFAMPSREVRLEFATEGPEFRVAGMTANEVNESMIAYISKRLYERRDYERSLASEQAANRKDT